MSPGDDSLGELSAGPDAGDPAATAADGTTSGLPTLPWESLPGGTHNAGAGGASDAGGAGAGPPAPGAWRDHRSRGPRPNDAGLEVKTAWTQLRARLAELQALGQGALQHMDEIVAALHHEDGVARQRAARILAQLGDVGVQKLLEVLSTDQGDARLAAAFGLAGAIDKIGGDDLARHAYTLADALTHWLLYPEAQVRADGAEALGRLGVRAKHTVNNLLDLLQDDEWAVRRAAARSLGQVGAGLEAVGPLSERLTDPAEAVRREAIDALGAMGSDAAQAVPALIAALDSETWLLKSEAAKALGRIGPAADSAVTKLQALLDESEQPSVRAEAATALGLLQAGGSREKLLEAARSADPTVAEGAIRALGALGNLDGATERMLIEQAGHGNKAIRIAAAEALGRAPLHHTGLKREGAWDGRVGKREALLAAAGHANPAIRAAATAGIGAAQGEDELRFDALVRLFGDGDDHVRAAALSELSRFGAAAAPFAIQAIDSEDGGLALAARTVFNNVGHGYTKAIPKLRAMLGSRDADQVAQARRALMGLRVVGPAGAEALPEIVQLLDDDSLRQLAAETLESFGPAAKGALGRLKELEADLNDRLKPGSSKPHELARLSGDAGAVTRAIAAIGR